MHTLNHFATNELLIIRANCVVKYLQVDCCGHGVMLTSFDEDLGGHGMPLRLCTTGWKCVPCDMILHMHKCHRLPHIVTSRHTIPTASASSFVLSRASFMLWSTFSLDWCNPFYCPWHPDGRKWEETETELWLTEALWPEGWPTGVKLSTGKREERQMAGVFVALSH